MAKPLGASHLIATIVSGVAVASGIAFFSVYSLYRGAADEAAMLRTDRDTLTAQVGSYVLDTGHGEIVCKNGLKLGPKELKESPLSPTERDGLRTHIKDGRCTAFLQKNDGIN